MSAIKKFLGQTAIYGVTTVISRLFNFILTPLFTGVFQPGIYAIFTKMYASASLINAILAFGMESTFFRYLNKYENKKQEVYNNTFFCVALIATLFLISGIVFSSPIAAYFASGPDEMADYIKYVHYFVWLLFIDAICVIPFAKVRADERPMRYSLIKFLNIGSFIGFNLFFLFVVPIIIRFGGPIGGWFGSWYRPEWIGYVFISNLIASVLTLILLIPEIAKLQLKFDKELFGKMVSYSWPVLVANLSFVVNENLDKMMLPKNVPHNHYNSEDEPVTYIQSVTPALDFELLVENIIGLTQDGKMPNGKAGLLQELVTMKYLDSKSFLADVPVGLQKILMHTIGPVARMMGYRAAYKEYCGVEK